VQGWARFRDGKTVEVDTETGLQVIRAETIVIATGSVPVELPFLPFGGCGDLVDRGAGTQAGAAGARRRRRRLHRP
jgi:pyruvate/2-oxoglutarate dehydrogenase complex dihydrolipoamide dehydrogenase (E3) component